MAKHGLTVAKATPEDIYSTRDFLQVLDQFFDNRYFFSSEESWTDWDDEDENKKALLEIRKRVAWEEGYSEEDVDNRLVLFEFIKQKYSECECSWGRVLFNTEVLIDNCCDPQVDILEFHPFIARAKENSILGE